MCAHGTLPSRRARNWNQGKGAGRSWARRRAPCSAASCAAAAASKRGRVAPLFPPRPCGSRAMQLRRCVPMTTRAARPSLGTTGDFRPGRVCASAQHGAPRSPLAPRPLGGRRPARGGRPSLCTGRRWIAARCTGRGGQRGSGRRGRRAPFARPATVRARVSGRIGPIGPEHRGSAGGWQEHAPGRCALGARAIPKLQAVPPGARSPLQAAQRPHRATSVARRPRCWSGAQRWTGSEAPLDFRRDFARAAPRRARATIWVGLRRSPSTHGRGHAEPAVARYRPSLAYRTSWRSPS